MENLKSCRSVYASIRLSLQFILAVQLAFTSLKAQSSNTDSLHFELKDSIILSFSDMTVVAPLASIDDETIYILDDDTRMIHPFSLDGERKEIVHFEKDSAEGVIFGFLADMGRFLLFPCYDHGLEYNSTGEFVKKHKLKMKGDQNGTYLYMFFDPVVFDQVLYFPSTHFVIPTPSDPQKYYDNVRAQHPIAAKAMEMKNGALSFQTLPSLGDWSAPYLTHHTLAYLFDLHFCIDTQRKRLYYNLLADPTIYAIDLVTGEKSQFGQKGMYLEANFTFPLVNTREEYIHYMEYFNASPKYGRVFYDEENDRLFRFYAGGNASEIDLNGLTDKNYLQVYDLKSGELLADQPFPFGRKIVRVAGNQLWLDRGLNFNGDYMFYVVEMR